MKELRIVPATTKMLNIFLDKLLNLPASYFDLEKKRRRNAQEPMNEIFDKMASSFKHNK